MYMYILNVFERNVCVGTCSNAMSTCRKHANCVRVRKCVCMRSIVVCVCVRSRACTCVCAQIHLGVVPMHTARAPRYDGRSTFVRIHAVCICVRVRAHARV